MAPALTRVQRLGRDYLHALDIHDPTLRCRRVRAPRGARQAEDADQQPPRHGQSLTPMSREDLRGEHQPVDTLPPDSIRDWITAAAALRACACPGT